MTTQASERLRVVQNQLVKGADDDIVVVAARRTPICKAKRGQFKNTLPCDLLTPVLEQVITDAGVDKSLIGDICVGNVLQSGAGAVRARMAQFFAGIPETVCLSTVNRQCSSGLQAVMNVAGSIKMGTFDIGIGAGFESMSLYEMGTEITMDNMNPKMSESQLAMECTVPMGVTSENVAERYGITREDQDTMAMDSHAKATKATREGRFKAEIVPITTQVEDKEGNSKEVTVENDEGFRPGTNMESLSRLKAVFKRGGTTTAGNSSQTSDGAAAVLLARRSVAQKLGLPIMASIKSYSVAGVKPDEMGIGPAVAIPQALQKAGLHKDDVDIYEINEAFASQAVYCVRKLGIPMEKVNPNGGAIALGHPLACTGARQIATLLHELRRRGKRGAYGVVSMCIGTGMGAAAVLQYEQ